MQLSTKLMNIGFAELGKGLPNSCCLPNVTIAYETYGRLNAARDNAVLVFHALSGSQHLSGINKELSSSSPWWTEDCYTGWWDNFVGSAKAIDTERFFVICANYVGGCYGSTGPSTIDPLVGKPYGSRFPHVTINDIVDSQMRLVAGLGIDTLHAVVGPSLGGMLALNLAVRYPQKVKTVLVISCSLELSILQRLSRFEQIRAIEMDSNFKGGDYYDGPPPLEGLSLARMIAHKSYVSLSTMEGRARSEVRGQPASLQRYCLTHPVESYMLHHCEKFLKRFDANTYLLIAEAWQRYDLAADAGARNLEEALARTQGQRFLVFSIDSDVCFYPEEQRQMVRYLKQAGVSCNYHTVHSDKGHDAFLLEPDLFAPYMSFELLRA